VKTGILVETLGDCSVLKVLDMFIDNPNLLTLEEISEFNGFSFNKASDIIAKLYLNGIVKLEVKELSTGAIKVVGFKLDCSNRYSLALLNLSEAFRRVASCEERRE
jgi:transcription initiation factor IIE alpha subunit